LFSSFCTGVWSLASLCSRLLQYPSKEMWQVASHTLLTFNPRYALGLFLMISPTIVKTGSIALHKLFILFSFKCFFFLFLGLRKKVCFFGSKFCFPDSSQKQMDTLPFFFCYFYQFWSKKYLPAFSWNRLSSVNFEPSWMKFSQVILLR